MKRLLIGTLFVLASAVHAHKVELVNKDGYMPLVIPPRIVFFATKEYTDSSTVPVGTSSLFIVTVDCKTNLHRRALTELYDPTTGTVKQMFKSHDEIADAMRSQEFSTIEPELVPITATLCSSLIK
jgi:hypothetical protein